VMDVDVGVSTGAGASTGALAGAATGAGHRGARRGGGKEGGRGYTGRDRRSEGGAQDSSSGRACPAVGSGGLRIKS